jgi:lipid A disaccharide synthetase
MVEKVREINGERVFVRHTRRRFGDYTAFPCEGAGKAASDAAVLAWARATEKASQAALANREEKVAFLAQSREQKIAEANREYEEALKNCNALCEAAKANLRALEKIRAKLSRPQTPAKRTDATDTDDADTDDADAAAADGATA